MAAVKKKSRPDVEDLGTVKRILGSGMVETSKNHHVQPQPGVSVGDKVTRHNNEFGRIKYTKPEPKKPNDSKAGTEPGDNGIDPASTEE